MAEFLLTLVDSLNSFNWKDLPETYRKVEDLLYDLNSQRHLLSKDLFETDLDELQRKTELSQETSTHYKWFLYRNHSLGYSMWLHEYKNSSVRRPGYAEVPHNHRYWFSSLILSGGFCHFIYNIVRNKKNEGNLESINKKETIICNQGDVYTFNNNIIHSLFDIKEPTLTFVIRSRGVNDYSESFDELTKKITKFTPFSARLNDFKKMAKMIH